MDRYEPLRRRTIALVGLMGVGKSSVGRRLASALGPDHDPSVRRALNLALAGALLQAGMGYFSYTDLAGRMDEVTRVVVRR